MKTDGETQGRNPPDPTMGPGHRGRRTWLAWLVGAAVCAVLILAVTHRSEEEAFLKLLRQIEPAWLVLALLLQAGTYVAQGAVWRLVVRDAGGSLPLGQSLRVSLAMLFVDQALPTAGASGLALVSGALMRAGIPPPAVASAVLVDFATRYLAYAACMSLALAVALTLACLPVWVMAAMGGFVLLALGLAWLGLRLPRRRWTWLSRLPGFPHADLLHGLAPAHRSAPLRLRRVLQASACHMLIFLLDAATLWVAVLALGVEVPPAGVFASFMVSSLFRTLGFMPGGLGTFEAASVMTLKSLGLPLSVGLSATLLFRGLSFWLPMLPGLFFSRSLLARTGPPGA